MQQPVAMNAEPIPGYRLIERLGRGGYGEVWKAEAPGGMHKAIKFVFGDMDGVGDNGKGAEQEFRSLNRVKTIRHPFILSLERIEIIDGQLLIVMELADRNLFNRFSEAVDSGLPGIPRAELLRYMEESAEALDLMNLHHQIQHLDIKPQNLFLVGRHIKVADFGLAKDLEGARTNLTGGITPMYAPPETFDGWVSRQSDQYSLAIVYMEMLIGKRPFNGSNTRQLILQHLTGVPDLAGLSPLDRDAVSRALAKKPDDRFPSCTEFVRALLDETQNSAQPQKKKSHAVTVPPRPDTTSLGDCATEKVHANKKSMPALVTPKSMTVRPHSLSTARKAPALPVAGSRVTAPVEFLGKGVLAPTLIVGLGGTGLSFLRASRQLISERFGRPTLPHLRWLQIDTDPAVREKATEGSSTAALESDDVLVANLRRPGHYLAREGMPAVDTWLNQEDLFRIPHTPATEGVRGIGRLALCDHYHAICHRIRIALEPLLNPSYLEEAKRITGLEMWTNMPRVIVATSLTGGTGSGMFLDCTYLIRRELKKLGCPDSRVLALLGVPAWVSQSSESRNKGNVRAALAELNHYHHAESCYSATFDSREGNIVDPGRPFQRVTLIPLPGTLDLVESNRSESLAAEILFTQLLTPLGRSIDPVINKETDRPFSVVGIQRLIWPRKAILRKAGTLLAQRTLTAWSVKTAEFTSPHPGELIETRWKARQLDRESLRATFEEHLKAVLKQPVQDAVLQSLRASLDDEDGEIDSGHVSKAFDKLVSLIGRPATEANEELPKIPAALQVKVRELGSHADSRLANFVFALIDQPGFRLAGAEEAIQALRVRASRALADVEREARTLQEAESNLYLPLQQQLIAPTAKLSLRGTPKALTPVETFMALRGWALARVEGQVLGACASVYRIILGNLPEHLHEVTVVRNQLGSFLQQLESGSPDFEVGESIRCPVFPDGTSSISDAAARLIEGISAKEFREFENGVQARVRHECRGVLGACIRPKEHGAAFLHALNDQAARFLEFRLTATTISPILTALSDSASATSDDRIADLLDRATPRDLGQGKTTFTLIGIPESAGSAVDSVRRICPEEVQVITGDDDFVIWRETRRQSIHAFPNLCGESGDTGSGHSRIDFDWLPLG